MANSGLQVQHKKTKLYMPAATRGTLQSLASPPWEAQAAHPLKIALLY
jgi:hypothetical protein